MRASLIFLFAFLPQAYGAFSNYNSTLIGDLAAGLSGAGTSVLGDVSSASFYNPALLGPLKGNSFSAAVGIYKKFDTIYDRSEDLFAAPSRMNKGYFRSLPSSTGSVIDRNGYKLALSIVTPDFDQFNGILLTQGNRSKSLSITDESLWVGGSLAGNFDETSSWGLSLYYTARNLARNEVERDVPNTNELSYRSREKRIKDNALVTVVGGYKKLNDRMSLGTSVRFTLAKFSGAGDIRETDIEVSGGTVSIQSPQYGSLKSNFFIPARLNLGLSYELTPKWLWTVEGQLHEGYSYNDLNVASGQTRVRNQAVVNYSLGTEYVFNEWFKLRGGFFTNFSAHPNPDPTLNVDQQDHVDMLGFSTNVVLISESKIAYTFGGYYTGGRGRSLQSMLGQYQVVSKTQNVFTMLVGTSFYF